jgi:hypothetical protein
MMPLYIKDDKVAELARDLAKRKRCTVTDVVRKALEREAREATGSREARWREIRKIQKRVAAEWQGPRTSDHDFLYDDKGDPIL